MAMANPPDLCFLWSDLIYTYAALFPPLPKHLIGKLTRSRDALGNILVKRVHNRVCDGEGLILRSEEHTSELQLPDHLVCRLLLEKKKESISPHNSMMPLLAYAMVLS